MNLRLATFAMPLALIAAPVSATDIDLSGATTGTIITAPGASFAQTFAGQTVAGTGVTGSPTSPLALAASGTIQVQLFDPGVSPLSNSLLSLPNQAAPLAILFDTLANSLTFTMGSSSAGSTIDVSAFDAFGVLTGSTQIVMGDGYNIYTVNTLGTFKGLSFSNDNDPAGVRFQNLSYNAVGIVPEPATWMMMLIGFGAIGMTIRRGRKAATARIQTA
jgi:PEP-CTERM motif